MYLKYLWALLRHTRVWIERQLGIEKLVAHPARHIPHPNTRVWIEHCIEEASKSREAPNKMKEAIAEVCHSQWSGWMEYLFSKSAHNNDGSVTIPSGLVQRWKRQMTTEYHNLSDVEQDSDRTEAEKFLVWVI